MTHFALVCPPYPSHVRVFETVGERLVDRGHEATLLLPDDARPLARSQRVAVATLADPTVSMQTLLRRAARPTGPFGILRTVRDAARATDHLCARGEAVLRRIGADAMIGDELEPAAGLLARHLGLPHVSLACALSLAPDPAIPPPFVDWPFDASPDGLKRNEGVARVTRVLLARQRRVVAEWALRFGLAGIASAQDCLSPLGTVAQTVRGFDFPRADASRLCHVGPIRDASPPGEEALPFAFDPARPLVYASLGTLQGHRLATFRAIAGAARSLGVQLVVAHCGGLDAREAESLGAHHVGPDLPQRAILAQADACITHGGLNTVLDALEFGVPLLAIPIAFDQPGVAARVEHSGAGLKLRRRFLSRRAVAASLSRLLGEPQFRARARVLSGEIQRAGGAEFAADFIEAAVGAARARTVGDAAFLAEAAE